MYITAVPLDSLQQQLSDSQKRISEALTGAQDNGTERHLFRMHIHCSEICLKLCFLSLRSNHALNAFDYPLKVSPSISFITIATSLCSGPCYVFPEIVSRILFSYLFLYALGL